MKNKSFASSLYIWPFLFFFIVLHTGCNKNSIEEKLENTPNAETCNISSPANGALYFINDIISFKGIRHSESGKSINFFWDFGDGTTSTEQEVTHQYTKEGTYLVLLTTTDADAVIVNASMTLYVERKYSISGKVLNKGQGVNHILLSMQGNTRYTAETDADGFFLFNDIQKGNYFLKCEDDKYNFLPGGIYIRINDHDIDNLSFKANDFIVLYDVDFSSPLHTVGSSPSISDITYPRMSPSNINFGNPHVVDEFDELKQQPCVFGGYAMAWPRYDQFQFDIEKNYNIYSRFSHYSLEMDLLIKKLETVDEHESFNILLDTPTIKSICFKPDGTIRYEGRIPATIGTFKFGEITKIKIDFDLNGGVIQIIINGQHLYNVVCEDLHFASIRLSMHSGSADSIAAVDNILIRDISNKSNFQNFLYDGEFFNLINYPGSDSTTCRGLNDHGDVVGYYWLDGEKYNFLRNRDGYQTIEIDDELNPELISINNDGIMIGEYDVKRPYGFMIDKQNLIKPVQNLNYDNGSFIGGINNSGGIVLSNDTNEINVGQSYSIKSYYGIYSPNLCINGINNSDYIVGNQIGFMGYSATNGGWHYNSFIYDGHDFITINYPSAIKTFVSGINDNNMITGFYIGNGKTEIFTYDKGAFHIIGHPEGYSTYSVGINNLGHILGVYRKNIVIQTYVD